MNKHLYNNEYRYTPEADSLSREVILVICPIFKKYVEMGYSPREISHIMNGCILEEELCSVLGM